MHVGPRTAADGGTLVARAFLVVVTSMALLMGLAACETRFLSGGNDDTPVQSWWDERGPVVPHDSFPRDCSTCHLGPEWETITEDFSFDHGAETGVVLEGAHATAECLRCHNDRGPVQVFASRGCKGCHEDPHRRLLGVECQSCHTEDAWTVKGDIGLHNRTRFPLIGAHAATACFRCHEGAEVGNFMFADVQCISCHEDDLAQATDPDHVAQGWVDRCDRCHIPTVWSDSDFVHDQFPLSGAHAATDCESCHVGAQFGGQPTDCVGCHMDAFQATTSPDHQAAGFPTDCEVCHTTVSFEGGGGFDHSFFPLTGSHMATDCDACHVGGVYEGTPTNCAGCHIADYDQTNDPDHAASGFGTTCETCHTPTAWEDADFNHLFFPLTGAHMGVDCEACHENEVYEGTPNDCASCHLDAYQDASDPDHQAAGFPTTCDVCHTPTTWQGADFDHDWWPLVGNHQAADCASCHEAGVFTGTPTDCASCHLSEYQQTDSPDHVAAGFPTQCEVCHQPFGWEGAVFDHSHFPLTGAHLSADCAECHEGGVFQGTPNDCASCHLPDYTQATNPDHQDAGFPTQCDVCHQPTAWQGASFDHAFFPLTGAHAGQDCLSCHTNGVYEGTPTSCVSCHLDDYNGANDPNHVAAGFPTECELCHQPVSWQGGQFDHDWWPLEGAHGAADCAQCHVGGVYEGTPTSCVSCHLDDYNGTTDPDHQTAGFPTQCEQCHMPFAWDQADFDHSQFPLTGSHAAVDCLQCHEGGVYEGTSSSCVSCHLDDYQATTSPDHQQAGFPATCETCHTPTDWLNGQFDHSWWPLTGQHQGADCASCHENGQYQGTPTSCVSCHLPDYNATNDPDHQQAGFPTQCDQCHTTGGWGGATVDHSWWPLTGQHAGVDCTSCHQGGQFQGTPTSCVSCHLGDYNATNNPNHQAAGFPTQCEQCHDTNGWGDGNFDHDFPLQGNHNVSCNECHVNPGNFNVFSCIECHAHNKNSMDNEHDDVNGYTYNSNACYNCHPDGND